MEPTERESSNITREERRLHTVAGKKSGKDKPKQAKEPMKNKGPKKK